MENDNSEKTLKDKELVGTEQLTEIYKIMSEKTIANLNAEAIPSNETYRMIAMVQDLYNQLNAHFGNYPRFPYWGNGFGNTCV